MGFELKKRYISSYTDLMKTIKKTITSAWGANKIQFTSAYPRISENQSINTPMITHKIEVKTPGAYKSAKEIKPRIREIVSDGGSNAIEIWGQAFDYVVSFEIWAQDGDEADELVERFQKFMFQYTGYFKKLGVDEIIFSRLESDTSSNRWRTDLINRTLTYEIRIDEIVGAKCPVIESITIDKLVKSTRYFTEIIELIEEKIFQNSKSH